MTYPDALSYLGQTRRFGMKLGLEAMRELAQALGSPQEQLRFIHIAGTNGKGSTAAFCESILRAAGSRVGLYTSPHLVSVRERIQVNRQPISEADFAKGMAAVQRAATEALDHEPTYFEIMTALALWYFAREKVDWVVWETGLGGRLDATNIVMPEICIITNIGLDHQQYLGQTLAGIAAEKAGIIKPGIPVVSAVESGEASKVIVARAETEGSDLTLVHRDLAAKNLHFRSGRQMAEISEKTYKLGLIGSHQVDNAACAVGALQKILPEISNDIIARGLYTTTWPGRFEILQEQPLIVLDGAHNVAGMHALVDAWQMFLGEPMHLNASRIAVGARIVFGCVADKDITEIAALLKPLARDVLLVRLANERGADPKKLEPFFAGVPCTCYDSVTAAWQEMIADRESIFLITGSLFLVGEMLARGQGNAGEYKLNERLEKFTPIR